MTVLVCLLVLDESLKPVVMIMYILVREYDISFLLSILRYYENFTYLRNH